MAVGAALDTPDLDVQQPAMPPIEGAPPGAAASPSQPAAPGAGATPALAQPQAGPGIEQGTGKGEIPTPPKAEFKPGKLAKVNTVLELYNAMTHESRKDYMDWWEKQHGDINDRYDHLKSQLGARPADDEPQSKTEKLAALTEFGLHLLKNSAANAGSTNQGAVLAGTLSDEHDAAAKQHQANIAAKQGKYDTAAQAIEQGRSEELKGIGTPAEAMKSQREENKDEAENVKARAGAFKDLSSSLDDKQYAMGAPTYAVGADGKTLHSISRDSEGHAHAEAVTGIDGEPFQGRILGREAGSGIDKGDPAAIRTFKYVTQVLGVDENTAAPILGLKRSGDPSKDHESIYRSMLAGGLGDPDQAKRIADQYVLDNYGAGALTRAHAPPVQHRGPGATPPPEALKGLSPGKVRDFGTKGKWTIGIDGKPLQVGGGAMTVLGGQGAPQTQQ